ncbi:MAG TPA: 4a-hydroxytetrahydrobiopterin dehydratase [Candidatus Paceibacterota bacterium]|nr:4a-hydroxytetrahydrobiopterin dehydratase [Candidatus Paceibacterota bacterium]
MDKPTVLTPQQIEEALQNLPGWTFKDDKISKEFQFADFMAAFTFLSGLAPYFEEMDHHPDIHIFYNKILFELQRFDSGGKVTDRDIIVAQEIERRFASL